MLTWSGEIGIIAPSRGKKPRLIGVTHMKAVKAVLTTVTVWHVAGKVNLTKSNATGKFIKNAIGQYSLDANMASKKTDFVFCLGLAAAVLFVLALLSCFAVMPSDFSLDAIYNNGAGHAALYDKMFLIEVLAKAFATAGLLFTVGSTILNLTK